MPAAAPAHSIRDIPVLVMCQENAGLLEATCSCLAAAGCREVHVLAAPMRTWARHSRSVRSFITLPDGPWTDALLLEEVEALTRRTGARVLLPVQTADVKFAARCRLTLPGGLVPVPMPDLARLEEVADKAQFTRLTASLGLPVPPALELTSTTTAEEIEHALRYPILAKALHTAGGTGIQRLMNLDALRAFLRNWDAQKHYLLQQELPGSDLAMTLLCEAGEVFAFNLRQRWFTARGSDDFSPPVDFAFIDCPAVEEMGRRWVRDTRFTGVADFDLIFDEASQQAWFLECDPRMMFSQRACAVFRMNVAALLVERALGISRPEVRATPGHFLSLLHLGKWIRQRGWRLPRRGPLRTGLRAVASDPWPFLCRRLGIGGR